MLCTFQHPPGAEARSFIASREDDLDGTCPAKEMAAIGSMDASGQGQPLTLKHYSEPPRGNRA